MAKQSQQARSALGQGASWEKILNDNNPSELREGVEKLQGEVKKLRGEIKDLKGSSVDVEELIKEAHDFKVESLEGKWLFVSTDLDDRKVLSELSDKLRKLQKELKDAKAQVESLSIADAFHNLDITSVLPPPPGAGAAAAAKATAPLRLEVTFKKFSGLGIFLDLFLGSHLDHPDAKNVLMQHGAHIQASRIALALCFPMLLRCSCLESKIRIEITHQHKKSM